MKTIATLACLIVTAICLTEDAQAQEFRFGPIGIDFGGQDHGQYDRDVYRPRIVEPGDRPVRPYNPSIYDKSRLNKLEYNPSTGRWEVKVKREVFRESATDPYRDVVDPGSLAGKSSISQDRWGRTIETRVESWTSYGRPHSKTTTRVISDFGNVDYEEETNVLTTPAPSYDD